MTEHTRNHGVSATPHEYLSNPGSLSESVEGDLDALARAAARARERHAGYRWAATPEELLDDERVSDGAVRLYGVLARYANRERVAWPGQELLAARMKRSESSIKRLVRELQATGWITVTRENRQRSNHYVLNTAVPGRSGTSTHRDESRSVNPPDPERSDLTPQAREVNPGSLTGQIRPLPTGQIWSPNESQENESQENESTPPPPTPAAPVGAGDDASDHDSEGTLPLAEIPPVAAPVEIASKPRRQTEADERKERASALAAEWYESQTNFTGSYPGLRRNLLTVIKGGFSDDQIRRALAEIDQSVPPVWKMEQVIKRKPGSAGRMRTYGEQEIARHNESRGGVDHGFLEHF